MSWKMRLKEWHVIYVVSLASHVYDRYIFIYSLYHTNFCSYSDFVCSGMIFRSRTLFYAGVRGRWRFFILSLLQLGYFSLDSVKLAKNIKSLKFNKSYLFETNLIVASVREISCPIHIVRTTPDRPRPSPSGTNEVWFD
jgi:hypothetical protein